MLLTALILTAASAGLAQSPPPETIFPSDGQDPRQAPVELLNAVCPQRVMVGQEMECRSGCLPDSIVGRQGYPGVWSLGPMYRGHFVSALSDDAVIGADGCEPHANNFGGTILLTRGVPGWTMLWYRGGLRTGQCHKVTLPGGRDILVCVSWYGGNGGSYTNLFVPDLVDGKPGWSLIGDQFNNCGGFGNSQHDPVHAIESHIKKVEFLPGKAGMPPIVSVTATFTDAWVKPDGPGCLLPPPKTYRIDFFFDGHKYQPTPATAAAAKIFEIQ